jgi:predicted transcriptional regulator
MRAELIIVQNEADHREARAIVHSLVHSERPEDLARLRAQALLVADWEAQHYPPVPPDPLEAIRFRIEQLGLGTREITAILGARSHASEVLLGKRKLSLAMIRRAHRALDIPLEVLVGKPEEKDAPAGPPPIGSSVYPDYIVCLEDGKKFKSLKRHLRTQYNMTPDEYRRKWGLPPDYPMVAPNYAAARSQLAKAVGLGRSRASSRKRG